jgi:hypothetical protein
MTLHLPDDVKVTLTVGQLRAMIEGRAAREFQGVGTTEAAEITGESPRTLRRFWRTWERIQHDGGRPSVRVSRKSSAGRSDLLFDRLDLMAWGGSGEGKEPTRMEPDPGEVSDDEVDRIVNRLLTESRMK